MYGLIVLFIVHPLVFTYSSPEGNYIHQESAFQIYSVVFRLLNYIITRRLALILLCCHFWTRPSIKWQCLDHLLVQWIEIKTLQITVCFDIYNVED